MGCHEHCHGENVREHFLGVFAKKKTKKESFAFAEIQFFKDIFANFCVFHPYLPLHARGMHAVAQCILYWVWDNFNC